LAEPAPKSSRKRSIVIEPWLALYCIAEDGAQVMPIMDGARDLSAIE